MLASWTVVAALIQTASPTTFFTNANIYTGNPKQPRAQAVAVRAGRIVFVGSHRQVAFRRFLANTRNGPFITVDLKGATLVPGLTDSHFHISGVGARELTFNLEGVNSLQEFVKRVDAEVKKRKPGEWVTGRGWIETFWKPQAFPTRQDLDRISPNNPVYLTRADGHAGIANTRALEIAGITRDTPDPFGGKINRDASGDATGMLLDKAQGLVSSKIVQVPVNAELALIKGSEFALAHGLCQVQVAGGSWRERDMLKRLVAEGKIRVRIYDATNGPSADANRLIQQGATVGDRFTHRGIKVVFDGALGSRGAALLEPYADAPTTSGFFTAKPDEVGPMLEAALRAGIQVETHAIGDHANRTVLDLYEKAFAAVPLGERKVKEPRWRIEHAQIIDPADIPRFGRLGVIASMQPSHAIGDLHFAPARVGIDRLKGAYAWKSLIGTGAVVAGGSDAPVERGDPMIEFYAAIGRRDLQGFSGPGWHPEQAVSRETALKMFTLSAAYAAFEERKKGTIEVGKLGDFTVLSGDIMKIPAAQIPKTKALMTVVGGEIVYGRVRA